MHGHTFGLISRSRAACPTVNFSWFPTWPDNWPPPPPPPIYKGGPINTFRLKQDWLICMEACSTLLCKAMQRVNPMMMMTAAHSSLIHNEENEWRVGGKKIGWFLCRVLQVNVWIHSPHPKYFIVSHSGFCFHKHIASKMWEKSGKSQ